MSAILPRIQSSPGNPIRRPPGSGNSSSMGTGGGGYSSASSYDDEMRERYYAPVAGPALDRMRTARYLFMAACFWPLAFLCIPPSSPSGGSNSHVSTGMAEMVMDVNDPLSPAVHHAHNANNNGGQSRILRQRIATMEETAHDRLDALRSLTAGRVKTNLSAKAEFLREEMSSLLRRSDVVGYGPDRPRAAVVVVVPQSDDGSDDSTMANTNHKGGLLEARRREAALLQSASSAVESIFRTADRNRIFVVTVVMDGRGKVGSFESRLDDIDAGRTKHRHGGVVHSHDHHHSWKKDGKTGATGEHVSDGHVPGEEEEETHAHSEKIHVIYNHESLGVSASRSAGAHFVDVLARKHEEAGLKSPEEDLILLFLSCDAVLQEGKAEMMVEGEDVVEGEERTWLDDVTDALIVPPLSAEDAANNARIATAQAERKTQHKQQQHSIQKEQRRQPANAVSFAIDYVSTDEDGNVEIHPSKFGQTRTFDLALRPRFATASGQDVALSGGASHPTPITLGAATAMRLKTYRNLPAMSALSGGEGGWERMMGSNHYAADLELSLDLWMCADGIDVLETGSGPSSSTTRAAVDPTVFTNRERSAMAPDRAAKIVAAWMGGGSHDGSSGGDEDMYAAAVLHEVAREEAGAESSERRRIEAASHGGRGMPMNRGGTGGDWAEAERIREMRDMLTRVAAEARRSPTFPSGLGKKCRPFSWYAEHVNREIYLTDEDEEEEEGGGGQVEGGGRIIVNNRDAKKKKILPTKPLDEARLSIVTRASPVKLAYVDASGGHTSHPHMGALGIDGKTPGYIHDETALHRDPPEFVVSDDERNAVCGQHGDPNWKMLTEKVFVDLPAHEMAEKKAEHHHLGGNGGGGGGVGTEGGSGGGRAKIFCLTYTVEKFHDRLPPLRETWGKKCDGYMAASSVTDPSLGAVNIIHEGPEEYNNMWQKLRSIWSYVYDNYYEKYDYFHAGGDDLYLIVENLRLYLESEEIRLASNGGRFLPDGSEDSQTPLFLGRRFAEGGNRDRMFNSGGSGYTMNKAALKTLIVDGFPNCFPHLKTFSEDVMVATCLRKMDILPYDTKDELGGERYMPFQPGHHLTYRPPANTKDDWYANYSVDVKWGMDHCAAKSVAFHYIKADLMKRLHAILYHYC